MENWKPVSGYVGIYEVSDMGRVRSVARSVYRKDGVRWELSGKERAQFGNKNGYMMVSLSKNGKVKTHLVHRVVMDAFFPEGKKREVNHIDGNKANNSIENLEWATSSENKQHAIENEMFKHKSVVGFSLSTTLVVCRYKSLQDAQKDGYSKGNICMCCNGRRKTHGGLAWRYA